MIEAFPLSWPNGWPRTKQPSRSRFDVSFTAARDGLMEQIRLLGGTLPVLSSDLELRRDGLPYAGQREPADKGVAVYFMWKGQQRVFACDRWDRIKDNIRALEKTIEAVRGIERWGASEMLDRAFSGFTALPAPGERPKRDWRDVLDLNADERSRVSKAIIEGRYRKLAAERHPDRASGSHEAMAELNRARDEALKEIGA